jgi:hypothetical protein
LGIGDSGTGIRSKHVDELIYPIVGILVAVLAWALTERWRRERRWGKERQRRARGGDGQPPD